jgi:hypothetical protein
VKPEFDDSWVDCHTFHGTAIGWTVYNIIASSAGEKPNHHYIHSVEFWDTVGPEDYAEASSDAKEIDTN